MNYILLKSDGSIEKTNFTEVINQNDNEVDEIFVSVEGLDTSTHDLVGIFVLPDGTISEEVGEVENDVEYEGEGGPTADGYVLTLTQNETKLAGIVYLTLQIKQTSNQKILYTYRIALTINESASVASLTLITLAQYNALLDYANSHFVRYSALNDYALKTDLNDYIPYTGATSNVNLNDHELSGVTTFYVSAIRIGNTYISETASNDTVIANSNFNIILEPDGGAYIGNTDDYNKIAVKGELPKKVVLGTFNTSAFEIASGATNYSATDIQLQQLSNFSDIEIVIITWDNCFAICPVPQSGPGRVCAALWNANGEAQTIRIRYEFKSDGELLDISLQGGFTPPSNHTAYVIGYKITNA